MSKIKINSLKLITYLSFFFSDKEILDEENFKDDDILSNEELFNNLTLFFQKIGINIENEIELSHPTLYDYEVGGHTINFICKNLDSNELSVVSIDFNMHKSNINITVKSRDSKRTYTCVKEKNELLINQNSLIDYKNFRKLVIRIFDKELIIKYQDANNIDRIIQIRKSNNNKNNDSIEEIIDKNNLFLQLVDFNDSTISYLLRIIVDSLKDESLEGINIQIAEEKNDLYEYKFNLIQIQNGIVTNTKCEHNNKSIEFNGETWKCVDDSLNISLNDEALNEDETNITFNCNFNIDNSNLEDAQLKIKSGITEIQRTRTKVNKLI